MKPINRLEWKLILALSSSAGALLGILEPSCRLDVRQDRVQVMKVAMAVEIYQLDTGQLPRHLGELRHAQTPGWDGPYIRDEELVDPWNRPLYYRINLDRRITFTVGTLGANGEPDGPIPIDDFWVERKPRQRPDLGGSPPRRRSTVETEATQA